jgi:hypothetical protein
MCYLLVGIVKTIFISEVLSTGSIEINSFQIRYITINNPLPDYCAVHAKKILYSEMVREFWKIHILYIDLKSVKSHGMSFLIL